MAERTEGKQMWKRKRSLAEAAARARAAKAARRTTDSSGDSEEPGPSSRQPASLFTEQERDETSANESESENERESDSSSCDENVEFNDERAQEVLDEFMVSLPSVQRKTLGVLLMHSFQRRQKMNVRDSAVEAGSIIGYNEKTVRKHSKEFFENHGKFPETKQGKYKRHCLLNDEDLRLEASMWVRENAYKKGDANLTAQSFCIWVNDHLLPSHNLPPELPRSIALRTATRWLRRLGFRPISHKKGAYVDGHERQDVVANRRDFLRELKELKQSHLPPPPCSDEMAAPPPPDAESRKRLVLIYHDESIFNASEGQLWMWAAEDMAVIRPKTKGSGIMVSDFIDQHSGFLRLTDEEYELARATDPSFPKQARALLEYGADRDGYWTGDKFMANIKDAARIAEFKYPSDRFTVVWLFDHSSCHRAFADDALNAKRMNVRPGGMQPKMRDTTWAGRRQTLIDRNGIPKGMKKVLEERGINTATMVADDMRTVLANHEDFRTEKTVVENYLIGRGHKVLFVPKFHCELNPIERVWGQAKVYTRTHTNYTLPRLRNIIRPGLDSVSLDLIRKYFRKVQDYETAYLEGKQAGKELEQAVKVYKSHRRIFFES